MHAAATIAHNMLDRLANRSRSASRKSTGFVLILETCYQIICVTRDDHVAAVLLPSPAFGPQVEHEVQVDAGEKW